jgi:hypothetical protein
VSAVVRCDVLRSGVMPGVAGELQDAERGVRVGCTSLAVDMRVGRGEVVVELGFRVISSVLGVVNVCKVPH